jgi:hypothetical protein
MEENTLPDKGKMRQSGTFYRLLTKYSVRLCGRKIIRLTENAVYSIFYVKGRGYYEN